LFIYI
jgi:hypothetical protein